MYGAAKTDEDENIFTEERSMVQIRGERRSNEVYTARQKRATGIDQTKCDILRLPRRMT
jgi:hypothetical protein